jgi:hypothetical protein
MIENKEDNTDRARSTQGRAEKSINLLVGNVQGRSHLGDLGIDRNTILK